MKLLITAFDAFGGDEDNISQTVLEALPEHVGETEVCKLLLPTVFGVAAERAIAAAEALRPDAIVCLGQAAGRKAITPERIAVNRMDATMPDNAGQQPRGEAIEPGGPEVCFSTLPNEVMVNAIHAEGVSAALSDSAGTFVCNSLLYAMLRWATRQGSAIPCGFVHLPRPDGELDAEALVRALTAALRVAALDGKQKENAS